VCVCVCIGGRVGGKNDFWDMRERECVGVYVCERVCECV